MAFPILNFARPVLPNNRAFLLSIIAACQQIFVLLAWEPCRQQLPQTTFELRSLVKDKVHAQDADVRAHLETLQRDIRDESVLRLLYWDRPLEKVRTFLFLTLYLLDLSVPIVCLQLCTLVLEQSLILAGISCKLTLDTKEWYCLSYCGRTTEMVVLARVKTLSGMLFPMFIDVISILMPFDFEFRKFCQE